MTDPIQTEQTNVCYRHPDRESFVRCQRCGRTICPQCQTQAAVGVHCPECVREARGTVSNGQSPITRVGRMLSPNSGRSVVTYSLMGLSIIIFILELLTSGTNGTVTRDLGYTTGDVLFMPWTLITASFVHGSILHLAFNMYSLFVLGPTLEQLLGRWRYLALFLISSLGGWVAVDLLAPGSVIGASAGIFGLLGALFVIQRRLGSGSTGLVSVIVLNLAIGFFVPNISWQAHVGGVLVGALVGFIFLETRARKRRVWQVLALIGVVVVLVIVSAVRTIALIAAS
jgi:membrane associated rhomboid family serine protease